MSLRRESPRGAVVISGDWASNMGDESGQADISALGRRDVLKKGAVAGAIVWTTPVIMSRNAWAAGGGTPKCRPTIAVVCERYFCAQGNKFFPGIRITSSPCSCAETVTQPVVCSKITNITSSCGASVAYGDTTICGPLQGSNVPDEILSTGTWKCIDFDKQVYFGRPRSGNGAIPDFGTGCTINFRLGVWAGECPDADSPTGAFNCQTFDAQIVWDNGTNTATCTITPASAANSLCTGVVTKPCTCA